MNAFENSSFFICLHTLGFLHYILMGSRGQYAQSDSGQTAT